MSVREASTPGRQDEEGRALRDELEMLQRDLRTVEAEIAALERDDLEDSPEFATLRAKMAQARLAYESEQGRTSAAERARDDAKERLVALERQVEALLGPDREDREVEEFRRLLRSDSPERELKQSLTIVLVIFAVAAIFWRECWWRI